MADERKTQMSLVDLGNLLKQAKEFRGKDFAAGWILDEVIRQPEAFMELLIAEADRASDSAMRKQP